jgi:hypothetical protein
MSEVQRAKHVAHGFKWIVKQQQVVRISRSDLQYAVTILSSLGKLMRHIVFYGVSASLCSLFTIVIIANVHNVLRLLDSEASYVCICLIFTIADIDSGRIPFMPHSYVLLWLATLQREISNDADLLQGLPEAIPPTNVHAD